LEDDETHFVQRQIEGRLGRGRGLVSGGRGGFGHDIPDIFACEPETSGCATMFLAPRGLTGPGGGPISAAGHACPTRCYHSGRNDVMTETAKPAVRPARPFFSSG